MDGLGQNLLAKLTQELLGLCQGWLSRGSQSGIGALD
jgi:hypothetical protein